MSCLVSCTSGLFQYTVSHVTESACVTPLGSDCLCLFLFYLVFGHEKGDKRHEAPGGRQDPSDMRHKARDRISARAKSATTATLQVALALAVGVSQPCRKVLLRGSPPESREMGPELGPRLQGPLKEGPVCGPRIRAALLGKKSPDKWRKGVLLDHFWKPAKRGSQVLSGRDIRPLDALPLGHLPRALWSTQK